MLAGIREVVTEGAYTLVLEFDSPMISTDTWQQKQDKMTTFFGPGVRVQVQPLEDDRVEIAIITAPATPVATEAA